MDAECLGKSDGTGNEPSAPADVDRCGYTFEAVHLRSPPKADAIIISYTSERTVGGYLIDQTSYFCYCMGPNRRKQVTRNRGRYETRSLTHKMHHLSIDVPTRRLDLPTLSTAIQVQCDEPDSFRS
jgi:hypothetical protein